MKTCPICGESVQDNARKCRHCGEWLDGTRTPGQAALRAVVIWWIVLPACGLAAFALAYWYVYGWD